MHCSSEKGFSDANGRGSTAYAASQPINLSQTWSRLNKACDNNGQRAPADEGWPSRGTRGTKVVQLVPRSGGREREACKSALREWTRGKRRGPTVCSNK